MIYSATSSRPIGVDRENNVVRGIVMAQTGVFKTRRGAFDLAGLQTIRRLAGAESQGLRSFFKHPTEQNPDPLERFLGRVKNPYMSTVTVKRNGKDVQLDAVRGDLHLDRVALKAPPGGGTPFGEYVLDLAESDSSALAASLQLQADKVKQLDHRGRPVTDADGRPAPPFWAPTLVAGVDIVATGDATSALLQAEHEFDDELGVLADATDTLLGLLDTDWLIAARARNDRRQRRLQAELAHELLLARARNRKRRAGLLDQAASDELSLIRAKWRNKKRRAGTLWK
jgi:hypothetical protein